MPLKLELLPKSIAIIIPYFGKLPWYFDYFIHSCTYNLSVHFFVITDDQTHDKKISINVFIIYKTFEEMKVIMSERLQLKINIDNTYKLCDFKPAYGLIFDDLIEKYDFWGYCDIDIIFGNIRNFITDKILDEYDVFTPRHDYLGGYFCLFRNIEKVNKLFTHSKDYVKVFSSPLHYCFDETNFHFKEFDEGKHFSEIDSEIESMTHVVKKMEEVNFIKAYFDYHVIDGIPGNMQWNKGTMIYKNKFEVMFYHLIRFKKENKPPNSKNKMTESFRISPRRIY